MVVFSVAAACLISAQKVAGSVMENAPVQTTAPALPNPTQAPAAPAEAPAAEAPAAPAAE